jgi:hypothetical protein
MWDKVDVPEGEEVPPYEESTGSSRPSPLADSKDQPKPSLHNQLSETRSRRIQSLLAAYVDPVLTAQAIDGLYNTILIVIPSDILTEQSNLTAKDIVSRLESTSVKVVRIHGDENRSAFWQQKSVLQELTSSLRARLAASGHKIERPDDAMMQPASPPAPLPQSQGKPSSSSWFKKQLSTPGPEHDPTASTNYKLGWRASDEDVPRRPLELDEVRVVVRVKDISFRVETAMGLLDSVTAKVLCLEFEVGT